MIILGTNSIKDTGFDVANSARFGVNTYMHKAFSSDNEKDTWTFSLWVKRGNSGSTQRMMTHNGATSGKFFYLRWESNEQLHFHIGMSDGNFAGFDTTQVFRDHSAWYHIVCAVDTTQGTEANRVKIYVNGSQVTAFGTANYPAQNTTASIGRTDTPMVVGALYGSGFGITSGSPQEYYDGYLAEVCFIDDAQLAADQFGEFDSDSGIWKPKDVSGLTFGTDGFYLDFEDSGNLGNDANGGTDLTEVNLAATDQSTDTCTNNMPVFNSNDNQRQGFTFTEGNLKITATPSYDYVVATMGVSSGKWYWETKIITIPNLDYIYNGISDHNQYQADWDMGGEAGQYCLSRVAGKIKAASGSETTYGGSMVANDIQGFALDVDNLKLYISNNGQWSNGSGAWDSTTFNASTGAINIAYSTLPGGGTHWFPAIGNGSGNIGMEINFGSPVSAISSGNADGNGYGNMEFPIPSGYFCLNTKNLAEYG